MREKYQEILHMPRPVSKKHPPMPIKMRSAQFAPYAALTGYDAVVRETARATDRRIQLDEYEIAELNRRLSEIAELGCGGVYSVTYFQPDKRKSGGCYLTETDKIARIDPIACEIVTEGGVRIPMREILSIEET